MKKYIIILFGTLPMFGAETINSSPEGISDLLSYEYFFPFGDLNIAITSDEIKDFLKRTVNKYYYEDSISRDKDTLNKSTLPGYYRPYEDSLEQEPNILELYSILDGLPQIENKYRSGYAFTYAVFTAHPVQPDSPYVVYNDKFDDYLKFPGYFSDNELTDILCCVLVRPPNREDKPEPIDDTRRSEYFFDILEDNIRWLCNQDSNTIKEVIKKFSKHEKFPTIVQSAHKTCMKKYGKNLKDWLQEAMENNPIVYTSRMIVLKAIYKRIFTKRIELKDNIGTVVIPSSEATSCASSEYEQYGSQQNNIPCLDCAISKELTETPLTRPRVSAVIRNYKPPMVDQGTQTDPSEWIIDSATEGKVINGIPCALRKSGEKSSSSKGACQHCGGNTTSTHMQQNSSKWDWNLFEQLRNFLFSSLWKAGITLSATLGILAIGYIQFKKDDKPQIIVVANQTPEPEESCA